MKAKVKNGHLVLNEPTTLPEGMEVSLVIDLLGEDDGDDLSEEERAALHAALKRGLESAKADRFRPAAEFLDELRRRR